MRLANLTWPQAEKVLAQDPVVIFPIELRSSMADTCRWARI